jgi:hypothetical protein
VNPVYHYPPELLNLLVDAIPLLFRGKKDVLTFFRGAGVPNATLADLHERVERDRQAINKFEIVRTVLVRLNEEGDSRLRERREVLKRVVEFEDFSTCWPSDQLKAKGLVSEIRRVTDTKDSFGRMRQEYEVERRKRAEEEQRKITEARERRQKLAEVRTDLNSLFSEGNPQVRGKKLEGVLNRLFAVHGLLVREAFQRAGNAGEGVVEQIDGVIAHDGEIFLVEMKWWDKPLGTNEVSQHLVRVFTRDCAKGILISYSGYTDPAVTICRESLSKMLVVLCTLQEIVLLLEDEGDLKDLLREKIQAAIIDKNPFQRRARQS